MSKVAIISGAAGGLGGYLAKSLWQAGYSLGLIVRRDTSAQRISNLNLEEISSQKLNIFYCDLGSKSDLNQLVQDLKNSFKRIDVLINAAAIHGFIGPAINNNLDQWDEVFNINLRAPMYLSNQLIPLMGVESMGAIINISGGGATGVRKNFSAYASSKTALVRYSEILSHELVGKNISVNCISPGILPTNLLREILLIGGESAGTQEFDSANQSLSEENCEAFDRVARLVNFLISIEGSAITGKLISAVWDNWELLPSKLVNALESDLFTLRRISGRDRKMIWADK